MKILIPIILMSAIGWAQQGSADAPPPPKYFVTIGAGFSQYSSPTYGSSGSFGLQIADGIYSITSLDTGTVTDTSGKRSIVSVVRTGAAKRLTCQGPICISALGDVGIQAGGPATVASFSGGGVVAYTFKKQPNAFVFGAVRVVKAPTSDPANANNVLASFTFGVGWRFN